MAQRLIHSSLIKRADDACVDLGINPASALDECPRIARAAGDGSTGRTAGGKIATIDSPRAVWINLVEGSSLAAQVVLGRPERIPNLLMRKRSS